MEKMECGVHWCRFMMCGIGVLGYRTEGPGYKGAGCSHTGVQRLKGCGCRVGLLREQRCSEQGCRTEGFGVQHAGMQGVSNRACRRREQGKGSRVTGIWGAGDWGARSRVQGAGDCDAGSRVWGAGFGCSVFSRGSSHPTPRAPSGRAAVPKPQCRRDSRVGARCGRGANGT